MLSTASYIVAAKRTAFGAFNGSISHLTATELAGISSLAAVNQLPNGTSINSCVFGNVLQTSVDAPYLARHVSHRAGLDISTPAITINRLCGSGFQSVIQAVIDIQVEDHIEIVLAGGTENMTQAPYAVRGVRSGIKYGTDPKMEDTLAAALVDNYPVKTPMGVTAENLAKKYKITRQDVDEYALSSQMRWVAGTFKLM